MVLLQKASERDARLLPLAEACASCLLQVFTDSSTIDMQRINQWASAQRPETATLEPPPQPSSHSQLSRSMSSRFPASNPLRFRAISAGLQSESDVDDIFDVSLRVPQPSFPPSSAWSAQADAEVSGLVPNAHTRNAQALAWPANDEDEDEESQLDFTDHALTEESEAEFGAGHQSHPHVPVVPFAQPSSAAAIAASLEIEATLAATRAARPGSAPRPTSALLNMRRKLASRVSSRRAASLLQRGMHASRNVAQKQSMQSQQASNLHAAFADASPHITHEPSEARPYIE